MGADTEEELLEAAIGGSGGAFERPVAPHLSALRGVVHRMVGHAADVADVVQEALVNAFKGLAGFRRASSFRTWFCAIGVRAAIDHLEARRRWRADAQVHAERECDTTPGMRQEVL